MPEDDKNAWLLNACAKIKALEVPTENTMTNLRIPDGVAPVLVVVGIVGEELASLP